MIKRQPGGSENYREHKNPLPGLKKKAKTKRSDKNIQKDPTAIFLKARPSETDEDGQMTRLPPEDKCMCGRNTRVEI